jgi:hypothetical protein
VLNDVSVERFIFGMITNLEANSSTEGDAFVVAPDGARRISLGNLQRPVLQEVCPLTPNRWGLWGVWFPHPMNSRDDARHNLKAILPQLKEKWEEWQAKYPAPRNTTPQQ